VNVMECMFSIYSRRKHCQKCHLNDDKDLATLMYTNWIYVSEITREENIIF
jgi:hypothetical protein